MKATERADQGFATSGGFVCRIDSNGRYALFLRSGKRVNGQEIELVKLRSGQPAREWEWAEKNRKDEKQ